jgi:acetyltransferase-like isoleucine patch superfamily enzyme
MNFLRSIHSVLLRKLPSFFYSIISGIPYDKSHIIRGRVRIIKRRFYYPDYKIRGRLVIGKGFKCNNKLTSNSLGLIQPCIFNIATPKSTIIIGDNVGISGSTIKAASIVEIGNNVFIGSGCLISDSDSHPIDYRDRNNICNEKIMSSPIRIRDNVFIGARSIVLKGVEIGEGAVIGAGSVVSKSIPPFTIAAGNPCKVIRSIVEK